MGQCVMAETRELFDDYMTLVWKGNGAVAIASSGYVLIDDEDNITIMLDSTYPGNPNYSIEEQEDLTITETNGKKTIRFLSKQGQEYTIREIKDSDAVWMFPTFGIPIPAQGIRSMMEKRTEAMEKVEKVENMAKAEDVGKPSVMAYYNEEDIVVGLAFNLNEVVTFFRTSESGWDGVPSFDPEQTFVVDIKPQKAEKLLEMFDAGEQISIDEIQDSIIPEDDEEPMTAAAGACPPATQDVALNLQNRENAIKTAGYGPMNPDRPNVDFWEEKAKRWSTTADEAKTSRCANCAVFIKTPRMLECIESGLGNEEGNDAWSAIDAGDLGYCESFDFKCAAGRTCDAWVAGGPVTEESEK